MIRHVLFCVFFVISTLSIGQAKIDIDGFVRDKEHNPLADAVVTLSNGMSVVVDSTGYFSFRVPPKIYTVSISLLGYKNFVSQIDASDGQSKRVFVSLTESVTLLEEVNIVSKKYKDTLSQQGQVLDGDLPKKVVSPFNDVSAMIATLPGVVKRDELSSTYSVRGGNYDENLVYVNDIPVYRPFLIRSAQQDGLSFVNPDLTGKLQFFSGGWQPYYGDKLSSVLAVKYHVPTEMRGSITVGLLGGSAHVEGISKNKRFTYLIGARHKTAQYLIRSFDVKGQYIPRYSDVQSLFRYELGNTNYTHRYTRIELLTSYAQNRFDVTPESRETDFGTINNTKSLFVAFEGKEELKYSTGQGGLKLSRRFNDRFHSDLILSGMKTHEREFRNILWGYKICDTQLGNASAECKDVNGVNTQLEYARNVLDAQIVQVTNRSTWWLDDSNKHIIDMGFEISNERINDKLNEYIIQDTLGYSFVSSSINSTTNQNSVRYAVYAQHSYSIDKKHKLVHGSRVGYWDMNKQLIVSPRAQYSWTTRRNTYFVSSGVYHQPPFYREMRGWNGFVNTQLKAQSSVHITFGQEKRFAWWQRQFKLSTEVYAKYIWNLVPYDYDNLKIRYYATNNGVAYAVGGDVRLSGQFIKGDESWISLGILSTKENIDNDNRGYIRRPTDQRFTCAFFFQDHLPNNPTVKVNTTFVYGSGIPFGVPNDKEYRSKYLSPSYQRLDVGFSKLLRYKDKDVFHRGIESTWILFEVMNLFGTKNVFSYLWVKDQQGTQYAIPNYLSNRFYNVRLIVKF